MKLKRKSLSANRTMEAMLSPREMDLLRLIGSGCSNKEMAEALHLSPKTVRYYMHNLYVDLGIIGGRLHLLLWWIKHREKVEHGGPVEVVHPNRCPCERCKAA